MPTHNHPSKTSRRGFLTEVLPAGMLGCLGCRRLLAASPEPQSTAGRFDENSGMSFTEVWEFTYTNGMIPLLKAMKGEMGDEAFMALLEEAGLEGGRQAGIRLREQVPKNDMASFIADFRENPLYPHALRWDVIEETDTTFEFRFTECLWAKTFRASDAAGIGFAALCNPDHAVAKAFNPKLKMTRSKTLMQGNECCNHRYTLEA